MALFQRSDLTNRSTGRMVYKHVYKGVTFYSSTGKALPLQQQQNIIEAVRVVPPKVWDRLAAAKARVVVIDSRETHLAPVMKEYFKMWGVKPKDFASMENAWGTDVTFTSTKLGPLAMVAWGTNRPRQDTFTGRDYTRAELKYQPNVPEERRGHVIPHEIAHAADHIIGLSRAFALAYTKGLTNTGLPVLANAAVQKKGQAVRRDSPGGWGNESFGDKWPLSATERFKGTIPKDYDAGYGGAAASFSPEGTYPSEVFAEALAHYWRGGVVPPKMQTFFDNHPDLSRHGSPQTTPVTPRDRVGLAPPK